MNTPQKRVLHKTEALIGSIARYGVQCSELQNLALTEELSNAIKGVSALETESLVLRKQAAELTMALGFATGHGDSASEILRGLEWQIQERLAL